MAKKAGEKLTVRIEVWVSPKLAAYLDRLIDLQGFGNSRPEVARTLVWDQVNELISKRRLKQL